MLQESSKMELLASNGGRFAVRVHVRAAVRFCDVSFQLPTSRRNGSVRPRDPARQQRETM